MTSRSSDAQSQSMQPHDILALANRFVARGAGETDLSLLLSSASDLLQKDITGDKARSTKKSDLATYTPNQVPSSSTSAPKSPKGHYLCTYQSYCDDPYLHCATSRWLIARLVNR